MCNRYVSPDEAAIERFWQIGRRNQARWAVEIFPYSQGPFIRGSKESQVDQLELVVGQWSLIPWFAEASRLSYSTNNARFEEISTKRSFKESWLRGKRCIIPAVSIDEPCWETGKNVWWRFRRADGAPWGLAGLWNTWGNKTTGEVIASYTMLTINADDHPLMSRIHKPDPRLAADQQDKRSVVAIEQADVATWLFGAMDAAADLVRPPPVEVFDGAPVA